MTYTWKTFGYARKNRKGGATLGGHVWDEDGREVLFEPANRRIWEAVFPIYATGQVSPDTVLTGRLVAGEVLID